MQIKWRSDEANVKIKNVYFGRLICEGYVWARQHQRHEFVDVLLRADLQWEEDHGETDHCSDADCHDDSVGVVEAGDHAHHVRKAQGENWLENTQKNQQY